MDVDTNRPSFDDYIQLKVSGKLSEKQGTSSENEVFQTGLIFEIIRLATFKTWPSWSSAMPNRLARFGFFYTGRDDEVQCFSCGCRVRGWNPGDLPDVRHRAIKHQCPLLENREKQNVSLPRPEGGQAEFVQSLPAPPTQEPHIPSVPHFPSAPARDHAVPPIHALLPDYKNEQARRETFRNWPPQAYVGPDELAQAGFIYLGTHDRVQCVFCKGVLRNWAPGDRAFTEHQQKFPHCPFVKNPRIGAPPERVESRGAGSRSNVSRTESPDVASLQALGIDTDMPKNHRMALMQTRIETYKNWPKTQVQKPVILAEAGFYFIDRGDSVKCYWCDGGLKNWEAGDDPWVEHTRWFPKCGHVKRNKGIEFVEYVSKNGAAPPGHSLVASVDLREVTARMDTATVKAVLDMGFARDFVQAIIYYRLATHGDDFRNSEELLDCVLNYTDSPPADFPLPLPVPAAAPAGAPATTAPAANASAPVATEAPTTSKSKRKRNRKKNKASSSGSGSSSAAAPSTTSKNPDSGNDSDTAMDTQTSAAAEDDDDNEEPNHGRMECRICMEKEVDILFLPCRHLVSCHDCAPPLSKCPLCRAAIKGTINVFMP